MLNLEMDDLSNSSTQVMSNDRNFFSKVIAYVISNFHNINSIKAIIYFVFEDPYFERIAC